MWPQRKTIGREQNRRRGRFYTAPQSDWQVKRLYVSSLVVMVTVVMLSPMLMTVNKTCKQINSKQNDSRLPNSSTNFTNSSTNSLIDYLFKRRAAQLQPRNLKKQRRKIKQIRLQTAELSFLVWCLTASWCQSPLWTGFSSGLWTGFSSSLWTGVEFWPLDSGLCCGLYNSFWSANQNWSYMICHLQKTRIRSRWTVFLPFVFNVANNK